MCLRFRFSLNTDLCAFVFCHGVSLMDFGGVGDGTTSNTRAFQTAVDHLSEFESDGGSMLFVPSGKWLTGSFNLTSHFTFFLHKDVVLLASQGMMAPLMGRVNPG
ncbi:hypothetical protein ABFS83_13G104000 [Erythranthe nasuta]